MPPKTFAAKLSAADADRLGAVLAGLSFGAWVRQQLSAVEAETGREAAEQQAQGAGKRLAGLEADLQRARAELEAVEGARSGIEDDVTQVVEEVGRKALQQVEALLMQLAAKTTRYGELERLVGRVSADLPLACVLNTMDRQPELVSASDAAGVIGRLALWSRRDGVDFRGPPPRAIATNPFVRTWVLSLADVLLWALSLVAGPEQS